MATINLITALKLIRYNNDDSGVVSVLQTTIEELERLQGLERHAAELASLIKNGVYDNGTIALALTVLNLTKTE
jgi:hypothetical protein